MRKLTAGGFGLLRKLLRSNPAIGVPLSGIDGKVPLSWTDEPLETRVGFDPLDRRSPFVETSIRKLRSVYHGYRSSAAFQEGFPYAELAPLKKSGGPCYSDDALDVAELKVVVEHRTFRLPMPLKGHANYAVECFKELGKIRQHPETNQFENNTSARIIDFDPSAKVVACQPASYFQQVGTNLTMDWASGRIDGILRATIRNTIERPTAEGCLPKLRDSVLANTLGVAAALWTDNEEFVIPIRSGDTAVMADLKGKFHCSASGVFEWQAFEEHEGDPDFSIFELGMQREIKRELTLDPHEYELFPIAFGRELARGGKPQLFFLARTSLPTAVVVERMLSADESWEFLPHDRVEGTSAIRQHLEAPNKACVDLASMEQCFTYEGWVCLELASRALNVDVFQ